MLAVCAAHAASLLTAGFPNHAGSCASPQEFHGAPQRGTGGFRLAVRIRKPAGPLFHRRSASPAACWRFRRWGFQIRLKIPRPGGAGGGARGWAVECQPHCRRAAQWPVQHGLPALNVRRRRLIVVRALRWQAPKTSRAFCCTPPQAPSWRLVIADFLAGSSCFLSSCASHPVLPFHAPTDGCGGLSLGVGAQLPADAQPRCCSPHASSATHRGGMPRAAASFLLSPGGLRVGTVSSVRSFSAVQQ
jgi:hypothetical protein